ncbi:hypothetical protein ABH931_005617 [Streptacidiphilus sp. MAP12-33]|uniref:hypothetical protein n=1 Tax=Streptacidiphilus sp. MAP12-33 TaxID=3156266 RepID=UPI00351486D6
MPDELTVQGLRSLLHLLPPAEAALIRERLGVPASGPVGPTSTHHEGRTPREPPGLRSDVLGAERTAGDPTAGELVHRLRSARGRRRLVRARAVVGQLRSADWPVVVRAHAAGPLPGIGRWAPAERLDCPGELRGPDWNRRVRLSRARACRCAAPGQWPSS